MIDSMTTFDRSCYTRLKRAVDALAGVCDGAEARDDEGFDGGDTKAGHLLAFLPLEAWPLAAFHKAWRWTFGWKQVRLEVVEPPKVQTPTEELVQDLLTIVTVFSGRSYGSRAKRVRQCVLDCLKAEEADGTDSQNHQTRAESL